MGASVSSDVITLAQVPMTLLAMFGIDGIIWPEQTQIVDNSVYDYIVIGGGTAGCVVARGLAEDMNSTVAVLEAGDDPPLPAMLSGLFVLLPGSEFDYNYTSTKDGYAARSQNNFTMLTAGKMLGGSSAINHLIYLRGCAKDFNDWAEITNDSSWNWENILKYYKQVERVVDKRITNDFRGTKGLTGISRDENDDEIAKYLKAFAEVGNPTVADLNSDVNVGFSPAQFTIDDNKRQTTVYTYLNPIKDYSNLHVSKNTRVTKIIFENNVAVAVEAVYKGKTYKLRANKEIIISAGTYNSAQLLQLSGIGPKEHLEAFGIDVINDLPVGDNMLDQHTVTLVHKLEKHLLSVPNPKDVLFNPAKIPFPVFIGFTALNKSQTYADYQTYNLVLKHDTPFVTLACKVLFGYRDDICNDFQKQVKYRDSLYTFLLNNQQKSRGTVRLRSANPFDDPVITTGFFTDKNGEDLENMAKYIMDFKRVGESSYFKKIGAGLIGLELPECADKEKNSLDFWKCYALNRSNSPYHAAGTCAMGKVVDSRLKVKGVENVRVVDASVMPLLPRGGPNAAVIMLAQKASDMIKSDNLS